MRISDWSSDVCSSDLRVRSATMSSSVVRRAARTAVAAAACAFALTFLAAEPAAAHSVPGGELPAPPWLPASGGAFGVLIVALALRSNWARPPQDRKSDV